MLAYVLVVAATLNSALGQAAFPRLARDHAAGNWKAYYGLLAKLIAVGLLAGATGIVAALVAGKQVLTLVYGPAFARHSSTLVVIMIVAALMAIASPLNFAMVSAGYRKTLIPLYGTVVVGAELASRWFIPNSGPTGGALAFLVTYVLQVAGSLVIIVHDAARSHGYRGRAKQIGRRQWRNPPLRSTTRTAYLVPLLNGDLSCPGFESSSLSPTMTHYQRVNKHRMNQVVAPKVRRGIEKTFGPVLTGLRPGGASLI